MTVGIIGAGIAGLSAAYDLVKQGLRPVLIEPESIGGMLRSIQQDGFNLEAGPNVLVERPHIMDLMRELGIQQEVRYPAVQPYGQFVWCDGRAQKVPSGPVELIKSSLFPWPVKLALPFKLILPGLLKPRADDVSVLEFFTPLIGEQVTRDMLDPVLKGIYGGDVEKLSARSLFPALWSAAEKGLSLVGYIRRKPKGGKPNIFVVHGGIQLIANALWSNLQDKVDLVVAKAERLTRREGGGYDVHCSDGRVMRADSVVLTNAGASLSSLIQDIDTPVSARIAAQEYASLTVAHLSVSRSAKLIPDAFGILFPRGMPENLLGVMFNSLIFPHVAPSDKHILTVIFGGAQAGDTRPDEERLRKQIPALLHRYLGIADATFMMLTNWSRAIPQLKVGHHELVSELDRVEARNPGVVFVGIDRGGVGVSDRVRLAREGVERLRGKRHG